MKDYAAQSGASLEGFSPADFDRFAVKGTASAEARKRPGYDPAREADYLDLWNRVTPEEKAAIWQEIKSTPKWRRMKELHAKSTLTPEEEEELQRIVGLDYEPGDVAGEFLAYQEAERKKQEAAKRG